MYAGTRIVSENPRTLYPGDIVEGALAEEQVALGNAEEIKEESENHTRLDVEMATSKPDELR